MVAELIQALERLHVLRSEYFELVCVVRHALATSKALLAQSDEMSAWREAQVIGINTELPDADPPPQSSTAQPTDDIHYDMVLPPARLQYPEQVQPALQSCQLSEIPVLRMAFLVECPEWDKPCRGSESGSGM